MPEPLYDIATLILHLQSRVAYLISLGHSLSNSEVRYLNRQLSLLENSHICEDTMGSNPVRAFIRISDLPDPDDPQGRSYREVNMDSGWDIPIGTLVELVSGARLFVVHHERDCDGTPLYWLSPREDDLIQEREGFFNRSWIGGYPRHHINPIYRPSP